MKRRFRIWRRYYSEKTWSRKSKKKLYYSEEDKIVRNIIYEFYIKKKIVPNNPKLLAVIRE